MQRKGTLLTRIMWCHDLLLNTTFIILVDGDGTLTNGYSTGDSLVEYDKHIFEGDDSEQHNPGYVHVVTGGGRIYIERGSSMMTALHPRRDLLVLRSQHQVCFKVVSGPERK